MITFKAFYEATKQPLGLVETLDIKGIGKVPGKVDSGNGAYNVIHGVNIKIVDNMVTFDTVNSKQVTLPLVDIIKINIGSGVIEDRPVIKLDVKIGDKIFKNTRFSIGNRSDNEYKILIGKDFIEKLGGLIDITKNNIYDK